MAVEAGGTFTGTIGGGEMENKILNQSIKYLSPGKRIRIIKKLYHSKRVNKLQSGLICAGAQTNYICSLDKSDLKTIYAILQTYEFNQTDILRIAPNGISLAGQTRNTNAITFDYKSDNEWNYEENIGVCDKIYIAAADT
jgi:xanthine dehydrogenase accessory factor